LSILYYTADGIAGILPKAGLFWDFPCLIGGYGVWYKMIPTLGEIMKKCHKCGQTKDLAAFSIRIRSLDGRQTHCKVCMSRYRRRYYDRNKELIASAQRAYRSTDRAKAVFRRLSKKWRALNTLKTHAARCLNYATKKDEVHRPRVCSHCWLSRKVQGHHPDYSKPLEVIWLCQNCHRELS
jgi:hypothetical protein